MARATCEMSLALCREIGERLGTVLTLLSLGYFAYRQDDYAVSQRAFEESLVISQEFNAQWLIALCLVSLGEVVVVQGQAAWAARLWGTAEALREISGLARLDTFTLPYQLLLERAAHGCYERAEAHARIQLGEKAFSAAWSEGRTMTPVQALALRGPARESLPIQTDPLLAPPPTRAAVKKTFGGLTEREREVAAYIAQGKSNSDIADTMVVSKRTVETHISNILFKLGFTSRTQIAVWATEKGLARR